MSVAGDCGSAAALLPDVSSTLLLYEVGKHVPCCGCLDVLDGEALLQGSVVNAVGSCLYSYAAGIGTSTLPVTLPGKKRSRESLKKVLSR